jgi:hypothetical protein
MQVTSNCPGRRRLKRPPLAAVLMLALAGLGGAAQAVEFDEKLKVPMMKSAADLTTQAKSFATKYREVRAATPAQMITNASLARQQFDLSWQLERSINERRPPGNLETMGFVSLGNGGYSVDTRKYPEWQFLGDSIATIFNSSLRDGVYEELLQRGFRSEDVAALKEYIVTHDVKQATRAATVPIALGFQRVVSKFDKAGRAVPDALVVSYWYQSTRAYFDANLVWSEGLLKTLDNQRVRVLLSFLSEVDSYKNLTPDSVSEEISGTLASVRSPDFEKRLMSTDGGAP